MRRVLHLARLSCGKIEFAGYRPVRVSRNAVVTLSLGGQVRSLLPWEVWLWCLGVASASCPCGPTCVLFRRDFVHDREEISLDQHELWGAASTILQDRLGSAWTTWFDGTVPDSFDPQTLVLTLAVPSDYVKARIEDKYADRVVEVLHQVTDADIRLAIAVKTIGRDLPAEPPPPPPEPVPQRPLLMQSAPQGTPRSSSMNTSVEDRVSMLNPRYSFDNFVAGSSNRFAYAAAMNVAEAPARSYNPLFIYGPAGLGKTHLLHAIAHLVQQVYPSVRVRYVTTETFMNEFVDSIRFQKASDFNRRYREVDVLLIDDIQFIEGKEGFQEAFFHTFNFLHNAHSQIVLSSDRPPKAIDTLEARLRSRFEWGLITDIQPPDLETRMAILGRKAELEGFDVPEDVRQFISERITNNVRELEGALTRVAAYSRLHGVPLDRNIAEHELSDLLWDDPERHITPELIIQEASAMFGIQPEELIGHSRKRQFVNARQVAMYTFRTFTDLSFPDIAKLFSDRDHTTVMHAVRKIESRMADNNQTYNNVHELVRRLKQGGG